MKKMESFQKQSLSKEIEGKRILELKYAITAIKKTSVVRFNSRIERTEERISEFCKTE